MNSIVFFQLSKFFNSNVACVINGTAALQLACQSIGLKKGDEVIVQSLTYIASFQSINACGATPIPCDISLKTLTADLSSIKKKNY